MRTTLRGHESSAYPGIAPPPKTELEKAHDRYTRAKRQWKSLTDNQRAAMGSLVRAIAVKLPPRLARGFEKKGYITIAADGLSYITEDGRELYKWATIPLKDLYDEATSA
jgi:hypothetical protein